MSKYKIVWRYTEVGRYKQGEQRYKGEKIQTWKVRKRNVEVQRGVKVQTGCAGKKERSQGTKEEGTNGEGTHGEGTNGEGTKKGRTGRTEGEGTKKGGEGRNGGASAKGRTIGRHDPSQNYLSVGTLVSSFQQMPASRLTGLPYSQEGFVLIWDTCYTL